MNSLTNLSPKQLRQAADIQEKILNLNDELKQLLDADGEKPAPVSEVPREQHRMSAAGRAAISAAAKARWAKINGAKETTKPAHKPKRKMSAAGRAAISAAAKARWAEAKAAGKSTL
jgi:hypothetical protein